MPPCTHGYYALEHCAAVWQCELDGTMSCCVMCSAHYHPADTGAQQLSIQPPCEESEATSNEPTCFSAAVPSGWGCELLLWTNPVNRDPPRAEDHSPTLHVLPYCNPAPSTHHPRTLYLDTVLQCGSVSKTGLLICSVPSYRSTLQALPLCNPGTYASTKYCPGW